MLDEKKITVYQLNLNKYIVTTWTLLEGSYIILISNNISSLNTKHKMLCFKETLTLGIDVFYEPNNSKWVMAKRSSGNLVLPFGDSSIFVKISVTISRSVDW